MNFEQQLILTLVDRLAIGVLLLLASFLLNRAIESYKSKKAIESEMARLRDEKHLEFLERQLSELYWPLYIRLEKDRSIWERILDINKESGSLEQRLAVVIEKEVILPNHKAMITRMHLARPEDELMEELIKYVKRATGYQALREAGDTRQFSTNEIGTQWLHQRLFEEIKSITYHLQSQYNDLVRSNQRKPLGAINEKSINK